jgi:hypothetical protein
MGKSEDKDRMPPRPASSDQDNLDSRRPALKSILLPEALVDASQFT